MSKIDFKRIYENVKLESDYDMTNEEDEKKEDSKSKDKSDEKVKDPKGKIEQGLDGMKPGAMMQAVAKQLGTSSTDFLTKHLIDIVVNAAKNGKVKFDALKDAVKDFGDKNIEDNSKIDWEHVEIDPSGTSMKCFFDGDSKKIIDNFMKEYESEMKDAKQEIEEADKKLHDDVKKAGVKIDDEKLDKNGLTVASVIDDKDNKGKSGKELTKEVDKKIEQSEKAKELIDNAKENEKKIEQIKVDPKFEKMSDDELAKAVEAADKKNEGKTMDVDQLVKDIDEKLTAKIGKDYKSSLLTGVYDKEELEKNAKKNKLEKIDFSKLDSDKVIGIRVDFFGDESKDVVSEVVDDKAGYVTRKIDNNEKDEGVKKIFETFSKILKDQVSDNAKGDIIAYLKHWQGKNDDGNFDSMFMFIGLKNNEANESINEDGLDAMKNVVVSGNNIKGFSAGAVINQAAKALGKSQKDIIELFNRTGSVTGRNMASKKLELRLTSFLVNYEKDPDKAVKSLMIGATNQQKDALAEIACKMKPDALKNFKNAGIDVDGTIDKITKTATKTKDIAKATGDSVQDQVTTDVANAVKNNAIGKSGHVFDYMSMNRQLNDLEDIYDDGKVTPEEFEKLRSFGLRMDEFNEFAEQNANSDNPNIQMKIALIKRLQGKYNNMILTQHPGSVIINAGESNQKMLDRLGTESQDQAKVAQYAESDPDAQKASGGWKKALGLDKAFTALGIARLAAKTTGIVLNNGKALIDMAGAQAMKYKEDKNIIADFRITLTNGEGSKSKFEDTKFAVRFDLNDCKWHATCLDDRKMKFPEDKLIKVALDSEEGKKFKKYCLDRWTSIFAPKDERKAIIPFILKNADKLGMKNGKLPKEFIQNIKKMSENFDKVQAEMK